MSRKYNVLVLSGGISAEREVSLLSGAAIAQALKEAGHDVRVSDISPTDLSGLDTLFNDKCRTNVVFPALHGAFGEDGVLQGLLEARRTPFVGSGSHACRNAMSKTMAKGIMRSYKIPTPESVVAHHNKVDNNWKPSFDFPVFAKPVSEGSSVGCKVCYTNEELHHHLAVTLPKFGQMLVEQFVDGLELTVGIIASRALPTIWIRTTSRFYDYEAKYVSSETQYVFDDIPLPKKMLAEVQKLALLTFQVLGCRDFGRVDIMVDAETRKPYVLEVNTTPGFTTHSLFPKAARQVGLSMTALCDQLVRMAIE